MHLLCKLHLPRKRTYYVPLVGKARKKKITGTFMVTMLGFFLSMQLIYKGTNDHCLPKGVSFPDDFDDVPKTIEAVSPKLSNI